MRFQPTLIQAFRLGKLRRTGCSACIKGFNVKPLESPTPSRRSSSYGGHGQGSLGFLRRNLTRYSCSLRERRSTHSEIADRELNTFIHFCPHRPLRCSPQKRVRFQELPLFIFLTCFIFLKISLETLFIRMVRYARSARTHHERI